MIEGKTKAIVSGTPNVYVASKHVVVANVTSRLLVVSAVGRMDDADFALLDSMSTALKVRCGLLCLYDGELLEGAPPRVIERGFHWATLSAPARKKSVAAQAIVLPKDRLAAATLKGVADTMPSSCPQSLHTTPAAALRALGFKSAETHVKTVRQLRKLCSVSPLEGRALSDRENQIVHYVMQGASDLNIASNLGLAESTVGSHMERIFRKCGVHSRAELARWFKTATK